MLQPEENYKYQSRLRPEILRPKKGNYTIAVQTYVSITLPEKKKP